jgi:hypothetical protein
MTAGWREAGGGEQGQQGLFGDADAAADADRAKLAAGDRLVELVAPDRRMAAASRTVRTSGSIASASVEGPTRSTDAVEDGCG